MKEQVFLSNNQGGIIENYWMMHLFNVTDVLTDRVNCSGSTFNLTLFWRVVRDLRALFGHKLIMVTRHSTRRFYNNDYVYFHQTKLVTYKCYSGINGNKYRWGWKNLYDEILHDCYLTMHLKEVLFQIQDIIIKRKNEIKNNWKRQHYVQYEKCMYANFYLLVYSTIVAGFNIQLLYCSLKNQLTFTLHNRDSTFKGEVHPISYHS